MTATAWQCGQNLFLVSLGSDLNMDPVGRSRRNSVDEYSHSSDKSLDNDASNYGSDAKNINPAVNPFAIARVTAYHKCTQQ